MADNYLSDLAYGLRQAATVLNPDIQRQVFAEDARRQNLQEQFMMSQMTPQAQMARLNLENEIGFRNAAQQANGDPEKIASAAMTYGKPEIAQNIYNRAEDRRTRLDIARQTNERTLIELQMKLSDKELDRNQRGIFQQMLDNAKQRHDALLRELGMAKDATDRLRISMMTDKEEQKKALQLQTNVRNLGTALERADLPNVESVLKEAENSVSNDKVLEYVNGPKSAVPDWAVSKEVTDARQAISRLFNITLKQRSGAAVTNQELDRLKKEFGSGVFKKPEQLRAAVGKMREVIDDHFRGIAAGYGEEALKGYNENLQATGGMPVLQPIPKISNDDDYAKLPSGSVFIDPQGNRRRKP